MSNHTRAEFEHDVEFELDIVDSEHDINDCVDRFRVDSDGKVFVELKGVLVDNSSSQGATIELIERLSAEADEVIQNACREGILELVIKALRDKPGLLGDFKKRIDLKQSQGASFELKVNADNPNRLTLTLTNENPPDLSEQPTEALIAELHRRTQAFIEKEKGGSA